jgi:hypothetical protein
MDVVGCVMSPLPATIPRQSASTFGFDIIVDDTFGSRRKFNAGVTASVSSCTFASCSWFSFRMKTPVSLTPSAAKPIGNPPRQVATEAGCGAR